MIDVDIQHLYQEPRLPLGKHVKHLVRFYILGLISYVFLSQSEVTECSNVTGFVFS